MGDIGRIGGKRALSAIALSAVVSGVTLGAPTASPLAVLHGADISGGGYSGGRSWAGLFWPALSALVQAGSGENSGPVAPASAPLALAEPAGPPVPTLAAPDVPQALWPADGGSYSDLAAEGFSDYGGYAPRGGGNSARVIPAGLSSNGIPQAALRAYSGAEAALRAARPGCRLDWSLLAAIGRVESDHGRYGGSVLGRDGRSVPAIRGLRLDGSGQTARISDTDGGRLDGDPVYDRAVGPMQFLPGTWQAMAVDGDGDRVENVQDIDDAALTAGFYLCAHGADLSTPVGRGGAVFRYNHSTSYVEQVLDLAAGYAAGTSRRALPAARHLPEVPHFRDGAVPPGPASSGDAPAAKDSRAKGSKDRTGKPKPEPSKPATDPLPKPAPPRAPSPAPKPCATEVEPNSSPARATAFSSKCGEITTGLTKTGHLATPTDVDYYTVTPDGSGNDLQVRLRVATGKDYDLAVTSPDAKTTTAPQGSGTAETLRLPTVKGATKPFTIRIRGNAGSYSSTKTYALTVRGLPPCATEVEPNSTAAKATAFSSDCGTRTGGETTGLDATGLTKTGHLATPTDVDYYTVTPDGSGNDLQVRLRVTTGKDYDLAVTPPDAETTTAPQGSGTAETLRLPTVKGATKPFTIRIRGNAGSYSSTKTYALTVSQPAVEQKTADDGAGAAGEKKAEKPASSPTAPASPEPSASREPTTSPTPTTPPTPTTSPKSSTSPTPSTSPKGTG